MLKYILFNLVPLVMVLLAAALIFYEKNGWGWFLLVAALMYVTPTMTGDRSKKTP